MRVGRALFEAERPRQAVVMIVGVGGNPRSDLAKLGEALGRTFVAGTGEQGKIIAKEMITGIEKVVPRLEDLALFWPMLATSGTGQPITTYSTLIGGPRGPEEVDGPEEFHVVQTWYDKEIAQNEMPANLKLVRKAVQFKSGNII